MNKSEWLDIFEKRRLSGLSIKQWCRNNGINYNAYLYWVKKLHSKPKQWAQVPVAAPCDNIANDRVNINCGKWTVTVDGGTSVQLLKNILQVVDEICS